MVQNGESADEYVTAQQAYAVRLTFTSVAAVEFNLFCRLLRH